ncbi:MAG: protein tyrosine phosphatase [Hyphomicrobiaceae bacterium]|nr:protein tyrosine phosphatase [Hyphomicrobiaceae bacterium]
MHDLVEPIPNRSGRIHVCPLSAVPQVIAGCGASHLVTCLQNEVLVETPLAIRPGNHMRLHIHDIAEPIEGHVAPSGEHVARLVDFAMAWDRVGPMVIHCWAGISRSTAAAFIALCALNPNAPEARIAWLLRSASPTAYPNRLMVRLGDSALGRAGRMVAAVEAIGRGEIAREAVPFSLPCDLSVPHEA